MGCASGLGHIAPRVFQFVVLLVETRERVKCFLAFFEIADNEMLAAIPSARTSSSRQKNNESQVLAQNHRYGTGGTIFE
jgi:hypothetical protein